MKRCGLIYKRLMRENMKIKAIIFLLISVVYFSACDDKLEPVADFSTSMTPYVEFTLKTGVNVREGVNANIPIRMRETLQQPVTVNYEITGAGAKTGSVIIPRGLNTVNIVVNFPIGTVPANGTTSSATITLKSATAGGENLTIGYAGTNQIARTITINK